MSHVLCASLCLVALTVTTADAQTIKLAADKNSGHDSVWVKRYAAGVNSWGIVGNHVPGTNGSIWFQSFPGATGSYKMELGAVLEPDGNSKYRVYVGGSKVAEGNYPYSTGSKNCSASTLKVSHLSLGTHAVKQGDQIKLWGEAVYPCGTDHGQYTRWFEIRFTKVGGPPGSPGTLGLKSTSLSAAESAAAAKVTVTRSSGSQGSVSVKYATQNGSATAGSDYQSAGGTLTWGSGDSSDKSFSIKLIDDSQTESTETVKITLSSPSGGAKLGSASGTLSITDNDSTTTKPTKILSPKAGSSMVEGSAVTLKGEGDGTLTWAYDANSDGKGEITIGTGASVSFKVPTGVTGQRTLTLYLNAAGGKVDQQHKIVSGPAPATDSGTPPAGDTGTPAADAVGEVDSGEPPASDGAASPDSGGGAPGPTSDSGGAAGADGAGGSSAQRGADGCTMMGSGAANPRVGALLVGFSFIVLGLLLLLFVLRRGGVE